MANNSISLVNLDFDTLKLQLKTYLKAQPLFADYDFDGSNMSVLLDILTYNTHLNAFYLNMVASEMFLDSAQLRNSIISKAKELNYTPRSYKSSVATLNCSFAQSGLDSFVIPVGTKFTGVNSNGSFSFVTDSAKTLYPSGGYFTVQGLEVYEGIVIADSFVADSSNEGQRFILTNDGIDTESISVTVSENNGQTNTVFQKAENLYGLTPNSAVYFVQATEDTRYELVFGDGVFGRRPLDGSLIVANYRATRGTDSNGSTNFILNTNLGSYNGHTSAITPTITVVSPAINGANAESIEAIRYNAPRHYQTQDRAVTTSDFKTLILGKFPYVKAVNVFGGEFVTENIEYGKVFISPATYSGFPLSTQQKRDIETYLADKASLGIRPRLIDPDNLYVYIATKIKYSAASTTYSQADIENIVSQAIKTFNTDELTDFDLNFSSSKLEQAINDADESIQSNETRYYLRKDYKVTLNEPVYIAVDFRNPVVPGSVYSSEFVSSNKRFSFTDFNPNVNTFKLTQQTDGSGVKIENTSTKMYLKDTTVSGYESYTDAGTIDYAIGAIRLNRVIINEFVNSSTVRFFAEPTNLDVQAKGNDLLMINESEGIKIEVNPV